MHLFYFDIDENPFVGDRRIWKFGRLRKELVD